VSLRTGCLAILFGLVAAVGLFTWSETEAGRPPLGGLGATRPTASARPATVGPIGTSASATPRPPEPTSTPAPEPRPEGARTATARPTSLPTPVPTAPPRLPGARQVGISLDELDRELKQALQGTGTPLRNPRVRLLPPDRVGLEGAVPIAIFQVPVEIEARLSVDDRGQVRVTTSRVQAVGASLPESVTAELGRRIDAQGTRAIADALPPGSAARRVVVEPDRIRVELAS
jgi:hypothetical protein